MRYLFGLIGFMALFFSSCGDGVLRGREIESSDSETYLVVEDDNGGACGTIIVDGVKWEVEVGEAGTISPGLHKIECGGEIQFTIKKGTTFYFDYWGP